MNVILTKTLALAGLCVLVAGAGTAALAQSDWHHQWPMHHVMHHGMRHAIMHQKMAYARDVTEGHYRAAQRAHERAMMIREHMHMHHWGMYHDGGY